MAQVTISVSSNAQAYWVAVDDQDVPLANGQGAIDLSPGEHVLTWWLVGATGQKISIDVKENATILTQVKGSSIPAGRVKAGGAKRFAS
jgi:hypothetical protein